MTPTTFRANFPEFASATDYPDAQINFWLGLAEKLLRPERWCDLLDQGLQLYVAHHLAIGRKNQLSAAAGGVPGTVQGPQSSKAVDKVSVSYDTGSGTFKDAGFWNTTTYGLQFWNLILLVGAGGVQL